MTDLKVGWFQSVHSYQALKWEARPKNTWGIRIMFADLLYNCSMAFAWKQGAPKCNASSSHLHYIALPFWGIWCLYPNWMTIDNNLIIHVQCLPLNLRKFRGQIPQFQTHPRYHVVGMLYPMTYCGPLDTIILSITGIVYPIHTIVNTVDKWY